MDHGSLVANICYEYFDETQSKQHRRIGGLYYFRNHSGGLPSAQLRLDVLPSVAWSKDPDTYFIGNFIASEKITEAPYVCGQIYVPSDKRGERTYIGHIGTRETNDGGRTQFYLQLFGVPLREINRGMKKILAESLREKLSEYDYKVHGKYSFIDEVVERMGNKKHSLYLGIELDG